MNRVREAIGRRAQEGAALVVYVTAGYPGASDTEEICAAAARGGADVIEVGVPFSDPNADGGVIQEAMHTALTMGGGLTSTLAAIRALRERGEDVPVVLFGYYNPIFVSGCEEFAQEAARAGVDAVLTVDLPIDELAELAVPLQSKDIGVIPLVAPTSTPERISRVAPFQPPFVYLISMTGVTGATLRQDTSLPQRVAAVRKASGAPVCVGFGIKTAQDARLVGSYADGVVVGSAVIERIRRASPGQHASEVERFVSELRAAIDGGDA